jgi:Flp pilus assembly protein TadD
MRREHARIAAISSLATLLLGCASTPAATPATVAPGKTAAASATASSKTPAASKEASSLPATSTNLEEQIQAAVALRMHGDTAQATRALAQLVLVAPDDPRVLGEYGKALVQQNRADDAVAFLKRAVEINANDWALYSALGVAYDQMDDRKNAKAAYDRALLLHPNDPAVLNNYAVSRMLAKDYDSAQRLLIQARAAGGDLPKIAGNLQLLVQIRASKAQASAGAKATTAPSEPQKTVVSADTPAKAADARMAPAVAMQRIAPDASSAQSTPAIRARPVSPDRTASMAPRAITPGAGAKESDLVGAQVPKSAAKPPEAKSIRAASAQKTKSTIASAGKKKPVIAQKDKAPVLPALRTAD